MASRSLAPRFPGEILRAARGSARPGARPAWAEAAARSVQRPRSHAPALWGVGVAEARLESAPSPALVPNSALRVGKGEKACVFQVAVAGARISNLYLSGEASPGRGWGARGTEGARVARLAGAARPRGWKREREPGGGAPASVPCGQSPARVGASPCLAPVAADRKCRFLFFPFSVVGLGSRFSFYFYFWKIGLTQHRKKVIKRSRSFSIT